MKSNDDVREGQESLANGLLRKESAPVSHKKSNTTSEDEWKFFLERFAKLRKDTYELTVSLSLLEAHTKSMHGLSESHKECILRICEVIGKKHNELIFSEKLMKEVVLQLYEDASF